MGLLVSARYGVLLCAIVAMAFGGCLRRHPSGTVPVDTVLKAWNEAGLQSGTVENVEPAAWNAEVCSQGFVAGLQILLCEYVSDEALALGEKRVMDVWTAESVGTGAVVHASRTLLAVTDRSAVDPSGRTIARLIKTFAK
jgi:hypothetical protein